MEVFLNKTCIKVEPGISLLEILQSNGIAEKKGIAVAVNDIVVRKLDWETKTLSQNDNILVISATKGG